jgi:hypothetical protein
LAGVSEFEVLAGLGDRLCSEIGSPVDADLADGRREEEAGAPLFGPLSPEDERLIAAARRSLERFAVALWTKHPPIVSETISEGLLDGAELVLRNELARGSRLATVMPGVVFLVALPAVDRDKALELSQHTASLLEGALG